jgi:hypothetical protein
LNQESNDAFGRALFSSEFSTAFAACGKDIGVVGLNHESNDAFGRASIALRLSPRFFGLSRKSVKIQFKSPPASLVRDVFPTMWRQSRTASRIASLWSGKICFGPQYVVSK